MTTTCETHAARQANQRSCGRPELRDEEGSALVEFALVLPVALLFLFGNVQCALALFSFGNATYACRVAARYASLHSVDSLAPATAVTIDSSARALLWTTPVNVSVQSTWTPSNSVGSTVTVSVRETLPFAIPFTSIAQFTVGSTTQRTILR